LDLYFNLFDIKIYDTKLIRQNYFDTFIMFPENLAYI